MRTLFAAAMAALVMVSGCAMTSGVMEAESGTYLISARAAPIRGGTAGANAVAYDDAQKFCEAKSERAIVLTAQERDVYQNSGASWGTSGGFAGGGTFAAGNANLHFKCEQPQRQSTTTKRATGPLPAGRLEGLLS